MNHKTIKLVISGACHNPKCHCGFSPGEAVLMVGSGIFCNEECEKEFNKSKKIIIDETIELLEKLQLEGGSMYVNDIDELLYNLKSVFKNNDSLQREIP